MEDLASRYRPRRYDDLVGQETVVLWLRKQAAMRKQAASTTGRSVLLFGPSGTGKTTAGLIYAKALSCETPRNGEACGGCVICKEFGESGLARISHMRGLVFRAPTMIAQWRWRGRARPWRGLRGWGGFFGGLRWAVGWIAAFFRRRGDASDGCDEAGGGQPPFVDVGTG